MVGMMPFCCGITENGRCRAGGERADGHGGGYGPHMMLGCLFVLSAVTGLFISNTATAVLMAPIALAAAKRWGCRLIHSRWSWRWRRPPPL
ncbi:hypothetical protein ACNKHL_14215 [Shigella flexneri]